MPEARDRLSRPGDVTAVFSRRQRSIGSIEVLADEPEVNTGTPFRWGATAMTGALGTTGVVATRGRGVRRGSFGTPRVWNGRRRSIYGTPAAYGRQNTPAGTSRRVQGSRSVLPSWYPRKPLHDITTVVQAIQRRRARLRESEGQQLESPIPQGQSVHIPSISAIGAPLEHDLPMISPSPTIGIRQCPPSVGKVPKILLDIANQNAGESDFLTPEKKLLNSIDTVEKVVMEELHRLKRTPTAKKAEREKKVRTLMSMR